MKLLFDENLSCKLVSVLADLYPGSTHVRDISLEAASDTEVWNYAIGHDMVIVSKDSDFHQRSFVLGSPPKVIWVRIGNCTTSEIEQVLRTHYDQILQFNIDPQGAFLVVS